jgi:hypothetical protein
MLLSYIRKFLRKKKLEKINFITNKNKSKNQSLNNIIDSITSMEEVEVLKKMIAPIAPTLTAVRQKNSQIKIKARKILIPHNKKIEPQRRLFSTTKKKRCTSRLRKPNAEETEKIAISAIVNSRRTISQKQM